MPAAVLGLRAHVLASAAVAAPSFVVGKGSRAVPVHLPRLSDPRLHLAAVITSVQVLGQTAIGFDLSIAQILVSVGTCAAIEATVTLLRERALVWPASAMLTGNGVALVLRVPGTEHGDWWSSQGWGYFMAVAALAMASKFFIRWRGRHVFNPSNLGLVVGVGAAWLLSDDPPIDLQDLWWGPLGVGLVLTLGVIALGALLVTRRVGMLETALIFWGTFAVLTAVAIAPGRCIEARWHLGPLCGFSYWWTLVTSPEVLIFLLFMITDPRTTPPTTAQRRVFAVVVAVVAAVLIAPQTTELGVKLALLAGLVIACAARPVIEGSVDHVTERDPTRFSRNRSPVRLAALAAVVVAPLVLTPVRGGGADEVLADGSRPILISAADVPPVTIDSSATEISPPIDEAEASTIAFDLLNALAIEKLAFETRDPAVARHGLTGPRLAAMESGLRSIEELESPSVEYSALTISITRPRAQSSPRITLDAVVDTPAGDRTDIFYLERVDGRYLLHSPVHPQLGGTHVLEAEEPEAPADLVAGLRFREVSEDVGIDHTPGGAPPVEDVAYDSDTYLQHLVAGAAAEDFDRDGDVDLFIPRPFATNLLYVNDGTGRFDERGDDVGVAGTTGAGGDAAPVWADVDGDGDLDLFVSAGLTSSHGLYIQRDDGNFTEEARVRGVAGHPVRPGTDTPGQSFGAAFGDVDGDGDLDLVTAQWRRQGDLDGSGNRVPDEGEPCEPPSAWLDDNGIGNSRLYLNDGRGVFDDATSAWGLDLSDSAAFQPVLSDIDGDDDLDLLVAGDYCTSRVFRNESGNRFEDVTDDVAAGTDRFGMGSLVGDLDADGHLDWLVTSIASPPFQRCSGRACDGNRAYIATDDGFEDRTAELGLRNGYWGWGGDIADLNLDGRDDVVQTNGFFESELSEEPLRLWLGRDGEPFASAATAAGIEDRGNGLALVTFDLEGDGDLDVLVNGPGAGTRLWRNELPRSDRWVHVTLRDRTAADDRAIGARVVFSAADWHRVREVRAGGAFESSVPATVHVAVPAELDGPIDAAVHWPGGAVQRTEIVPGRAVVVTRR